MNPGSQKKKYTPIGKQVIEMFLSQRAVAEIHLLDRPPVPLGLPTDHLIPITPIDRMTTHAAI
jgi:hypothetical protein